MCKTRVAKVLDETSGAAVHASELAHEGGQARSITGLMRAGYLGFEGASTAATGALVQDEMVDVHLDRWQLNDLMGVVRCKRHELAVTAGTGAGLDQVHLGGAEQGWGLGLGGPFARRVYQRMDVGCAWAC